jgi:DNA repair exonuclease SbcCD ATPase subunit
MDELRALQRLFLEELEHRTEAVTRLTNFRHGTGPAFAALTAKFNTLVRSFIQPALDELQSYNIEKSRLVESLENLELITEVYRSAAVPLSRHLADQTRTFSELYTMASEYAKCAVESDGELRRLQGLLVSLSRENASLRRANQLLERRDAAMVQALRDCLTTETTKAAVLDSFDELRRNCLAVSEINDRLVAASERIATLEPFEEKYAAALIRVEERETELGLVRENLAEANQSLKDANTELEKANSEIAELRLRVEIQSGTNEDLEQQLETALEVQRAQAQTIEELREKASKSDEARDQYAKAARHWKGLFEKGKDKTVVEELETAVSEKDGEIAQLKEQLAKLGEEKRTTERVLEERIATLMVNQDQGRPPPEVEPPESNETRMIEEEDVPEKLAVEPEPAEEEKPEEAEAAAEHDIREREGEDNAPADEHLGTSEERGWSVDNNADDSEELPFPG